MAQAAGMRLRGMEMTADSIVIQPSLAELLSGLIHLVKGFKVAILASFLASKLVFI